MNKIKQISRKNNEKTLQLFQKQRIRIIKDREREDLRSRVNNVKKKKEVSPPRHGVEATTEK